MTSGRLERWPVPGILLVAALVFALTLALPGVTVTTAYVNDLFIFIDGAHRVASGQVPNRDFHTALGPLTYYLPAFGYWISGTFGGAMPAAMAAATLALALPAAHILGTRMNPVIALAYGLFLLMIPAVPMNLGEPVTSLSFAMFYNRIGWAGLSLLLAMYLVPRRRRPAQDLWDGICATFLTAALLYIKVTYGLVALAFLGFMLFDRAQRRWAAGSILAALAIGIVVELFWRASLAHLADLVLAGEVSGRKPPFDLALGFLRHLPDYVLFGVLGALALWRSRSWRDLLFFGFCAGPGLVIQIQNSQPWGIITIQAGAAVAAEIATRPAGRPAFLASGAPLALAALLVPTTIHCLVALGLHTTLALRGGGEPLGLPRFERIRLADLWSSGDPDLSDRYLATMRDGVSALQSLGAEPRHVSVLDFANPFSASLDLTPPKGDSAWLHWNRNVSAAHHLKGEDLLGGVDVLMLPKWGINHIPLRELYGPYIATAFEPVRETQHWTIYLRRAAAPGLARSLGNHDRLPLLAHGTGTQP